MFTSNSIEKLDREILNPLTSVSRGQYLFQYSRSDYNLRVEKKAIQVSFFERPNSFKFREIRGICTEGPQLYQYKIIHEENFSLLEVRIITLFFCVGTEVFPVFIVMVYFSSITWTYCSWHRRLENSCKLSVGKSWTILLQSGFGTQKVSSVSRRHFSGLHFTCDEDAKHATVTWLTQE